MGSGVVRQKKEPEPVTADRCLGREVQLTINGKPYTVSNGVPAETSLNTFIREHAHLKGTKFMCLEGGCGACIVSLRHVHPSTKKPVSLAVNSCLVPIFACHGWAVTTVEGLGSREGGYDKIQKRLAAANGTQCGYCSPGMVMNMYSLLAENPKITMLEVENSFGGNICRCTGYRPIMDAFKSLASDAPKELTDKLADIEDMVCPESGKLCGGGCGKECHRGGGGRDPLLPAESLSFTLKDGGGEWYRPLTVKEVFELFDMVGEKSYRFVAGNTGQGVYRITEDPEVYIDVNGIPELHSTTITNAGIVLGANISLTDAMNFFYKTAKEKPNKFTYCKTLADHIDLIANVPVRNTGTFAGNIAMKHAYKEFPSDIFLILETVGAQLVIEENDGIERTMSLPQYLETDMKKKLITKILLPNLDNNAYITHSYKIMPRAQNAHAYVNAGFMFKVEKKDKLKILEKPTIVFGGIKPNFLHAEKTEKYLEGKRLVEKGVLEGALGVLQAELEPDHVLPDATPAFRKGLALSLFYKFVLSLVAGEVDPRYKSGGETLQRPVSSARQDFDTDRNVWPLNKPIPKIEALIQCAGEAEYTNDIPYFPNQVWGQLVLCDRALAPIQKIDPSEALKMKGVVAFLSAKDIPGTNNFSPPGFTNSEVEPVFADVKTEYAGQALGVVFAETHETAIKAAKKVKVSYGKAEKPSLDAREVVDNNIASRIKEYARINPKQNKTDVKYKVEGKWDLGGQYHYTMETQTCVAVPIEDCMDLYPSSQWPSTALDAVSLVLGIPQHKLNVRVRRLGGGYGAKLSRSNHVTVVAALGAHLLHRPVRVVLSLETNMEWAGKRFPVLANYEANVSETGEIQNMVVKIYEDDGHTPNDSSVGVTLHHFPNCYDPSTWTVIGYGVDTDLASNSWCRAPGSTEAICLIENIMEHIARVVKRDPLEVRLANLKKKEGNPIPGMIEDMKASSDYENRVKEVTDFNKSNRWRKRGISLVAMDYPFSYFGNYYGMVSIFQYDGSVSVTHGGIEMGQGLNTKVAQVAAYILGIDLDLISIKPTTNHTAPNNTGTGGSLGSEAVSYAVKECCEELNRRLEPIKKKLGDKATWREIISKAGSETVNLNATYMFTKKDNVKDYPIYGVTVSEVEVDLLTGQYQLRRVDLMEDAGQSLSPEVDVGQVEGAFIMGVGYFTSEELVYAPDTGRLLTNRTWNYKPPGAKDIPVDFRITLRKNSTNPVGVLRSKATGEPPFCMSCTVILALRNALESGRRDAGQSAEDWFDIEHPFTGEKIWLAALNKKEMFKLS